MGKEGDWTWIRSAKVDVGNINIRYSHPISIFYCWLKNPFKPFHLLFRKISLTCGLNILFLMIFCSWSTCFFVPVFYLLLLQKAKFNMWGRRAPSENRRNAHDCAYFLIQVLFDVFKLVNIISKQWELKCVSLIQKDVMVWRDLPCG